MFKIFGKGALRHLFHFVHIIKIYLFWSSATIKTGEKERLNDF